MDDTDIIVNQKYFPLHDTHSTYYQNAESDHKCVA